MKLIIFFIFFFGFFLNAFSSHCSLYERPDGHIPIILKTGEFMNNGFRVELNNGEEISDFSKILILRKSYFQGKLIWKKTGRSLDKRLKMISLSPGCILILYEGYNFNNQDYKVKNPYQETIFINLQEFEISGSISSARCICF